MVVHNIRIKEILSPDAKKGTFLLPHKKITGEDLLSAYSAPALS